ncbi:transcriptional regulator, ArsR family [Stappia indica]|uniref:Transcriptional regulator, ArsR family n=3 Tax=Stappia indica TaxID=538381 RepID=A0A285S2B7_9HYPH|nr:transcriptional regulator, ArsR family [Stappia indica]
MENICEPYKLASMNIQDMESKADEAAALLASMANSRRLLVLCHLVRGEYSVGALAERVGLSQSALSQHLAKMRVQGLVEARREGQTVYYRLAGQEVLAVLETLYGIYCGVDAVPEDAAGA